MTTEELLAATKKLRESLAAHTAKDGLSVEGFMAKTREFLRVYAGPKTAFYESAKGVRSEFNNSYKMKTLESIVTSFEEYLKAGLYADISPERRAQIDVVSDILDQAQSLLDTKGVHPAAPAVLIGAALEEFLRTWTESVPLPLGKAKPGISTYGAVLRREELITKQDVKDLTSWGGIRNHAAHGEWDQVSDKKRVELALEGVNLFMRRYGA